MQNRDLINQPPDGVLTYNLIDISEAPAENETAAYLREALARSYTIERWRIELGQMMSGGAGLRDLAAHAMLARTWTWHTQGAECQAWREEAERLDRYIIVSLAQGWRRIESEERE